MSVFKQLLGQTALYGLPSILGRTINFLLVILYTDPSVLSVAQYGEMTELYAYVAFLMVVFTFGMETTYFRFANRTDVDPQRAYNQGFTFLLTLGLTISGLFLFLSPLIADGLGYVGHWKHIALLAGVLFVDGVLALPFARLRQQGKAKRFATAKLTGIGATILLNLFFLVLLPKISGGQYFDSNFGVGYVFLANLIGNFLMGPFLWRELRAAKLQWDHSELKRMLKYAWPLLVMGLAGMVNEMLDRAILKEWLPENFYPGHSNQEALGIYGACYRLSMLMTLGVQAYRYAAEPFFFARAQDKKAPKLFGQLLVLFVALAGAVFLGVSLMKELVADVFLRGRTYHEGLAVVPILLLANLFLGIFFHLSTWYKLTDRTSAGMWLTVLGAGITVVLNILLIPNLGYLGSAWATLACYFGMTVVSYFWGQKHYPIPYPVGRVLLLIGVAVAMVAARELFLGELSGWQLVGLTAGGLVLYLALAIPLGKTAARRALETS